MKAGKAKRHSSGFGAPHSCAYRSLFVGRVFSFQHQHTAGERQLTEHFLRQGDWPQLAQVLLASNEFQFID